LLSAIGLLALAGANVASIRYSKMSQYKGTATSLIADLSERIRANKSGLASYALTDDFATQGAAMQVIVAAATTSGARNGTHNTNCETYAPANCTAAQLAAYDLANWRLLLWDQLPEGAAIVSVPVGTVGANVWVAWRDPAVADADENSTDSRNAALECPADLNLGVDKSVRCSFFRINL
jgi:type IV pilus assembly protein PilV